MRLLTAAVLIAVLPCAASAEAPLQPALAGLTFLMGNWGSGTGKVAETGGTATGSSVFTGEVNGAMILRRDHTELRDASGKPSGGFDQMMTIYAEGGAVRGDYADGTHVIHYVSAAVEPGKSVTFTSASQPRRAGFSPRLYFDGAANTDGLVRHGPSRRRLSSDRERKFDAIQIVGRTDWNEATLPGVAASIRPLAPSHICAICQSRRPPEHSCTA